MGSDSRVRGADSVSMAAILPGPVQAWPRPGHAPRCQSPTHPSPRAHTCSVCMPSSSSWGSWRYGLSLAGWNL